MKKNNQNKNEKLEAALARLEEGVHIFQNSDEFKDYLKTMSRFHSYSFNNSLLIFFQKPDATHCAGYTTWKSMGRQVKAGEKGITILAPAFKKTEVPLIHKDGSPVLGADGKPVTEERIIPRYRATTTFDYSQTEGEPLPEIISELKGEVADYEKLFGAVKEVAEAKGAVIGFEDIQTGAKGYYSPMENRIAIKSGMSEVQNIKTFFHELTHARLDCMEFKEDVKTDRCGKETRAEACAFVCCEHFGIDCSEYSFPYLSTWASGLDLKELREQMDTIRKTASEIITEVEETFGKEIKMDKPKERKGRETALCR